MAQYKVPQDVEAEDKLIGPFSFRQFVYLLIAAGLAALAVGLFQLFPLLAIIPVPFVFFFLALALPLKKDQPMETYLAAIVSYYLKPRERKWMPGQKEAAILITAPKIKEEVRTRNISGEEATNRLSFLADIVDTEGYAIKGAGASPMREDLVAEANATPDMFENYQSQVLNRVVDQDKMTRHQTAVQEMQEAIRRNDTYNTIPAEPESSISNIYNTVPAERSNIYNTAPANPGNNADSNIYSGIGGAGNINARTLKVDENLMHSSAVVMPNTHANTNSNTSASTNTARAAGSARMSEDSKKPITKAINDSIIELANNKDFSVATIAKEANRINRKEKGEVFVSLH